MVHMTKTDTQVSVFMGTTHGVEDYILTDEVERESYHFKFYMPKSNLGETIEDTKQRVENQIDFLFSKSFMDYFLEKNLVTQAEYDKCLKFLRAYYLNNCGAK